jgi:iron(III) transport system substrate-binding protein
MIRMGMLRRLAVVAAALLLSGTALAQMPAWEKTLYEGAKKEKEFTIYTAHYNSEIAANLCKGFEKKYPGVTCKFSRQTAQVTYQRFMQDMQANLAVASVVSSTDVGHFPDLKRRGLLMTYVPHNLSKMSAAMKAANDKENTYWVTSAGLVVLSYNTQLVPAKDAPKKWTDLLDPKWKGKVTIGHPGYSGYVGTWVVMMRKLYGWEFFEKLEKNQPQIGRSINDTNTMLNAKERWIGASSDATTLQNKDKGNPQEVIYPEDGSMLMISPTGIPKNAPAPNAAKLWVEYMLDREAADVQLKDRAQVVIKGVKALPGGKSYEDVKIIRPTEDEIIKGIPEVIEKFRDTFGV